MKRKKKKAYIKVYNPSQRVKAIQNFNFLKSLIKKYAPSKRRYKKFLYSFPFRNKYVARREFKQWFFLWEKKSVVDSLTDIKRKNEVSLLKKQLKCNLHSKFFKPWKYEIPFLTEKQDWLQAQYETYRFLPTKDRVDFFRTQFGQMMLASVPTLLKLDSWSCSRGLLYQTGYAWPNEHELLHQKRAYLELRSRHKKSWFYENIYRRKKPASFSKFKLTNPVTAFHSNWKLGRIDPWLDRLLFKRAALSAFEERYRKENKTKEELKMKHYLRKKNPRYEKRNKLYKRKGKLLANSWQKKRLRADKAARIKQIAGKIVRPFYGHLSLKQFSKIIKKSKKRKFKQMSRTEAILRSLENRLDVVVYRLNWAPNILWARRLISEGSIFVSNLNRDEVWNTMHSNLKTYAFPLKLRDPKNLYKKFFWNPQKRMAKYKFLSIPKTEAAYLVQPGDLIQCSQAILISQFKNNSVWLDKPNALHLLSTLRPKQQWSWGSHRMDNRSFFSWKENSEHIHSAVFLFNPRFRDLPLFDRVKKSFFRWAII
jgi:hypothetical protein